MNSYLPTLFQSLLWKSSLLTFGLSGLSGAAVLHLAYGVDTQPVTSTGEANPFYQTVRVRDHHVDHYHTFSANSTPFELTPGGSVSITVASMNYSLDNGWESRYFIPNDGEGSDFRLSLVGLTGPDGSQLILDYAHGDHTHPFVNQLSFEIDETHEIFFSLPSGAVLGNYSATFVIGDQAPGSAYSGSSPFTVHFTAVPEPAGASLAGVAAAGLLLRRRRC